MERVKTDDNNTRMKGYLLDNQHFTPPPEIGFGEG